MAAKGLEEDELGEQKTGRQDLQAQVKAMNLFLCSGEATGGFQAAKDKI